MKLWTQETLHGTTFKELEPAERAIWFGFLCLAGDSPFPGIICLAEHVPYTMEQLAQILKAPPELVNSSVSKMLTFRKVNRNGDNCFVIANWEKYQGDVNKDNHRRDYMRAYMRQRRGSKQDVNSANINRVEQTRQEDTIVSKDTIVASHKKKTKEKPDPRVMGVMDTLEKERGYHSGAFAAEAGAVKWMLKQGYTPEDILDCWRAMGLDPFWEPKPRLMTSVKTQIGAWAAKGKQGDTFITKSPNRDRVPKQYTPPPVYDDKP